MSIVRSLLLITMISGLTATGCSKSSTSQASSESSSGSSAGSSKSSASSSGSSSPSSREEAYVSDVRDFTAEWVLSGGDVGAYKRRVAEIAEQEGITDWEQDDATYEGIGRGLKKAGLTGDRYSEVSAQLAGSVPQRAEWMKKGYDSESKQ